jgi:hypothetical protein
VATAPDLGLYEALIDQVLARRLPGDVPGLVAQRATVDDADLPLILADHVGRRLAQGLRALVGYGQDELLTMPHGCAESSELACPNPLSISPSAIRLHGTAHANQPG